MTNYLRVFGGRRPRSQRGALSKEDQRHLKVLHYVEDMTPEQLDRVVDDYVRHRAREREAAAISAEPVPAEESER